MRINDNIRKTVAFIGLRTARGFTAYGTAFIVATELGDLKFQTLVTARHVIERIPGSDIALRFNTRAGGFEYAATAKANWHDHPDPKVDVSVAPVVLDATMFDIMHIALTGPTALTDDVIVEHHVGIGDEVFVAGMFTPRLGETKNIPIVRIGNIAAMAEEEVRTEYGYHHAYLIEARSIDGLSGSPVHVHRAPVAIVDNRPQFQWGHLDLFMGMLLGHNQVENPGDTVRIQEADAVTMGDDGAAVVTTPWNSGIGVVLPISYVLEAVNQPALMEARRVELETHEQAAKRSYVSDAQAGGD